MFANMMDRLPMYVRVPNIHFPQNLRSNIMNGLPMSSMNISSRVTGVAFSGFVVVATVMYLIYNKCSAQKPKKLQKVKRASVTGPTSKTTSFLC